MARLSMQNQGNSTNSIQENRAQIWRMIFAISSVIAVSIDPLFLYIPILDKDKKCLGIDRELKIIAVVLRCVFDLSYILHIVFQVRNAFILEADCVSKGIRSAKNANLEGDRKIRWSDILIDFLALLPLPQVLILAYFSKVRRSESWLTSTFLNFLVVAQYMPRVLRLYLSCQKLKTATEIKHDSILRLGAILNLVLYIVASHVIGALWYFFSIQRETECWHHACEKHGMCVPTNSFVCQSSHTLPDFSLLLSSFCSVNPRNMKAFDYGIFADAIQSGILQKTSFFKKFIRCFWWGLRNVSSFGQNLETSTHVWETCFAVSISIIALLLFIYLIGNIQMYFQKKTAISEEIAQRMIRIEEEIDNWVRSHSLPASEKVLIIQQVQQALEDDRESFDLAILRCLLVDRVKLINHDFIEGETDMDKTVQQGSKTEEQKG